MSFYNFRKDIKANRMEIGSWFLFRLLETARFSRRNQLEKKVETKQKLFFCEGRIGFLHLCFGLDTTTVFSFHTELLADFYSFTFFLINVGKPFEKMFTTLTQRKKFVHI